jgi:Ca2+-binding EF-hand superfamily protein
MWRAGFTTLIVFTFFTSAAAAQQPCTTDARLVVDELYRHMLEREADPGSADSVRRLQGGQATVRDIVREIAISPEHIQRFLQAESGEAVTYERAVVRLYRHMLDRRLDPAGQRAFAELAQRINVSAVVDQILASPEYRSNLGDFGVPGSTLRLCSANGQSWSAPSAAPPQAGTQDLEPRFRRMDTNSDGTISNREWQGTRQTFRDQDWNNDGVLSGEEVSTDPRRIDRSREEEAFNRQQRFEVLDVNKNNRVDFNEWQGSVTAFDRLDRNSDGILTRGEITGNARGQQRQQGAVATTGNGVVVDSRQRWTDSGLDVRAGEMLTITTSGSLRLAADGEFASAGGLRRRAARAAPLPQSVAGGLIARIGNGAPIFVGDRPSIRAPGTGRLYFGVNDDNLTDNSGEFTVSVSIR